MREIKFRAFYWTEHGNEMLSWEDLNDGSEFLLEYFNNSMSNVSPVMQFTGLKDKNGTEIYEGDYIIYRADSRQEGVVVWSEKSAGFSIQDKFGVSHHFSVLFPTWCEVIGNQFQNPELLEKAEA